MRANWGEAVNIRHFNVILCWKNTNKVLIRTEVKKRHVPVCIHDSSAKKCKRQIYFIARHFTFTSLRIYFTWSSWRSHFTYASLSSHFYTRHFATFLHKHLCAAIVQMHCSAAILHRRRCAAILHCAANIIMWSRRFKKDQMKWVSIQIGISFCHITIAHL